MKNVVFEFRPDKFNKSIEWLRWNNGNPIKDDGQYDLAFIANGKPFFIYVEMPYHDNILWKWCKGMRWRGSVNQHPDGNPWHYMLKENNGSWDTGERWDRNKHPNEIAGNKAREFVAKRNGCANGIPVEFNVLDETINAGLLRIVGVEQPIVPPKIFRCMYCGEHNWCKEENILIAQ